MLHGNSLNCFTHGGTLRVEGAVLSPRLSKGLVKPAQRKQLDLPSGTSMGIQLSNEYLSTTYPEKSEQRFVFGL